jgi:hypothetical protein
MSGFTFDSTCHVLPIKCKTWHILSNVKHDMYYQM